jgi:hypothetical protein
VLLLSNSAGKGTTAAALTLSLVAFTSMEAAGGQISYNQYCVKKANTKTYIT